MVGWAKVLPHPTTLILPSKCQSRGGLRGLKNLNLKGSFENNALVRGFESRQPEARAGDLLTWQPGKMVNPIKKIRLSFVVYDSRYNSDKIHENL